MATKTITGSYTDGYALSASYHSLIVAEPATVYGGSGLTSDHSSFIDNLGKIRSARRADFSVSMTAGGTFENGDKDEKSAFVATGISITGGVGTVDNYGAIGGRVSGNRYEKRVETSVVLGGGGSVKNGRADDTAASITNGISIAGGRGDVENYGKIAGLSSVYNGQFDTFTYNGVAIALGAGGRVSNEASGRIVGVSISAASGTVVNAGLIQGPSATGYLFYANYAAVVLGAGGAVTNDASGTIDGVSISAARGKVVNDGTINGSDYSSYDRNPNLTVYSSVTLNAGGSVVNGSATDATATLTTGVTLEGAGTVTNFGMMGANSDGVAVSLAEAGDTLIEEGTGVLDGTVAGGGGRLLLAGDAGAGTIGGIGSTVTGFAKIKVEKGADWTLDGATLDSAVPSVEVDGVATFTGTTSIAETLSGTGFVVFGTGSATLEANTKIKTKGFSVIGSGADLTLETSLYYAGTFSGRNGADVTLDGNSVLMLQGTSHLGSTTIEGSGRLTTKGSTTTSLLTLGGTASWINYGAVTETQTTTLGVSTSLTNASGATFTLAGDVGISGAAKIYNDGTIVKASGSGLGTVASAIKNDSTIEAASGTLKLGGAISGSGLLDVDDGAILEIDAAVGSGQTVALGSGTLALDDAAAFNGTVTGFGVEAKLDVTSFSSSKTSLSFVENGSGTSGILQLTDGDSTALITIAGNHAANGFHLQSDAHGGSLVTYGTSGAVAATSSTDPHAASLASALFDAAFSQPFDASHFSLRPPSHPTAPLAASHLG